MIRSDRAERDKVEVQLDPERLHFFDRVTEQAIGGARLALQAV